MIVLENYFEIVKSVKLFKNIEISDLESMLVCLGAEISNVRKGQFILLAGQKPEYVGVVISGQLHIVREDAEGNRTMIAALTKGEIFAEALCCAGIDESPVTVSADMDSAVMLLKFEHILHTCPNSCSFHIKLIENMLGLIAGKNLMLQNRMEIISTKSVRMKVLRYLESLALKQGRNITIPFNREELADYLFIERSSLSHELSRMKRDGLIDYRKNKFVLK